MDTKKLQTLGLCKSYDNRQIVEDINISINTGEIVALLGTSGGGKTTLFNMISGLEKPDTGQILLEGNDITGSTGNVSYMQQKDLLMPYKTILDNVSLPLVIKGTSKKEAREYTGAMFDKFGLEGTQNKYPSQLSGGMKQRASFLRAYLFSNEIMLLDEPFSALDAITKADLHEWYLTMMQKTKVTTLFVTHDLDEAIYLSDRIYILSGKPGRISKEIIVKEARPRNEEFKISERFLEYKREIISYIR